MKKIPRAGPFLKKSKLDNRTVTIGGTIIACTTAGLQFDWFELSSFSTFKKQLFSCLVTFSVTT